MTSHLSLYVRDQNISTGFYKSVLGFPPRLNVPGMTEFQLSDHAILGLMPEKGIARLLGDAVIRPEEQNAPPRSELYLVLEDLDAAVDRAIRAGAVELSRASDRDWGHRAGYYRDPDGHVLALAEVTGKGKDRQL